MDAEIRESCRSWYSSGGWEGHYGLEGAHEMEKGGTDDSEEGRGEPRCGCDRDYKAQVWIELEVQILVGQEALQMDAKIY